MRFSQYLLAGAAAVSSVIAGLEDAKFSTKLTSSNFDSAISGKGSLVAFFAPWCGHCKSLEPTWTKVAKAFEDEDNVVVGHLDADNESNRPVASRYGVKGYPTIKWFSADGSAPQDYQGPRSEDAFIAFINEHAGTHRTATGVLNELAGRIPSLDTLVASFLSSSADARAAIVSQANQLSSQFTAKTGTKEATAASYYLKVMEKLSESSDWAQTELARLQKLASKRGTMAQKQVDDLQIRQNILAAFTAAKASASSIISDASASIDSATSKVAASASSASNAAFGAGNSAVSSVSGQAASASANAQKVANDAYVAGAGAAAQASKSASSASANAGNYANSAYAAGASAASQASASAVSAGNQAGASVVSASNNAKGYANSAYAAGANAASQASASGASAASQASASAASASANAAGYVNDAYASGASGASQVSKSAESAASQASASVDSAISAASKSAASAYSKVAGEL